MAAEFGAFSDTAIIGNNSAEPQIRIALSAADLSGSLRVTPQVYNISPTGVGDSLETAVVIIATQGAVRLSQLQTSSAEFLITEAPAMPYTIPLYDTLKLTLRFRPFAFGLCTDSAPIP